MPVPTREDVFGPLFTQLQTVPGITTFSRRMMEYSEIAPDLLPALILWEQPEDTVYDGQGLPKNTWQAIIAVFFQNPEKPNSGDPNTATPGATIINPLIDAVRAALAPDSFMTGSYTIGGLVEWCRVEGKTIVETGDTDSDGRGGALIPIEILVPSLDGV